MVDGLGKAVLMRQASLFVLPTYSENFGVVVAESLMAGVPVITTHGAPWECLVENDCGWWIPTTIDSLRDTLLVAMSTPESVRKAMGQRGVSLMGERFAWPSIAKDMITVYDWILGGGTPPSCVEL
jgi:glycosyltransferase involved in cell wall biosynthesis